MTGEPTGGLVARSTARPVMTAMAALIVVVLGISALFRLQTDMLPPVELPTLSVSTDYEGASPEVVERLVTSTLEEILATVPGIEELTSESSLGRSRVSLRFAWGTDIDMMATQVRAKLEDELNELPENIGRPEVRTFDVASFPIVILGVSSDLDPVALTTIVDEQVAPRLARVPGLAQVDPWGEYEREIRVEIDPERLRAFGVSLDEVHAAVRAASLDLPTGRIEEGDRELLLRAPSGLTDLSALERTVVVRRDNGAVRVEDVAHVVDTHRRLERIARIDGELGLRLALRKEADANTVEVARLVHEEVERINADLPHVHVRSVVDQGDFIDRSIDNVATSILYGGVLAILVLFMFLRSMRSTLIVGLAIPVSLIATFALIFLSGFTLNLMTLGGLALGVGMMVDNSIVVLDNIYRRRQEHEESAMRSAVLGAREVSAAIIASSLTTVVIFLPLLFVEGVSGQLFRELAYVVAFSLLCSLLVSLTLVPVVASRLLAHDEGQASAGWLTRLESNYRSRLGRALDRPWRVVALCSACLLASLAILPTLESELFPPSDEGQVDVTAEMEVGTRLGLMDRQTRALEHLVEAQVPEAVASVVSVGTSGRRPGARGSIQLALTPSAERTRSNEEIAEAVREAVGHSVPGVKVRVRAPQGQFLMQRLFRDDGSGLAVEITGPDLTRLDALTREVQRIALEIPGVADAERTGEAAAPQVELRTDRDAAADLNLDPSDVANALEVAIAGRLAGEYREGASSIPIRVQLADAPHRNLTEILDLTVMSGSTPVPLRALATAEEVSGPTSIERKNQRRIMTVHPNVADRPVGTVAAELVARLRQIPTPAGYEIRVAGSYEEQQRSSRALGFAFLLAILLVYMVLAAQYESFRDPLIVMLSVPMAATGVFVILALTGTTLNVQSYVGCIMLGGIVVNNAVLLVDQTSQLRREGAALRTAIVEAGRRRLRPILMTTSTTALALVPLALGIGEGADAQAPLARAVLGGLVGSTMFTLLLVPAAYALMHRRD